MLVVVEGQPPHGGQSLQIMRYHANDLFKAAFGGRIIVIKKVSTARLEQKLPVGWTNPAGPFENFCALSEVTAQAALIGGLNHPVQGVHGSQRRWFHHG